MTLTLLREENVVGPFGTDRRLCYYVVVIIFNPNDRMDFYLIAYVTNQIIAVLAVVCLQLRLIVIIRFWHDGSVIDWFVFMMMMMSVFVCCCYCYLHQLSCCVWDCVWAVARDNSAAFERSEEVSFEVPRTTYLAYRSHSECCWYHTEYGQTDDKKLHTR